jgi:hypothetical protein
MAFILCDAITLTLVAVSPVIGGSLSHPATRFPATFGSNEFLIKYPYFLPCAVPATFTAIAWLTTYFLLKEVSFSSVGRACRLMYVQTVPSPSSIAHLFKCQRNGLASQNVVGSLETGAPAEQIKTSEKPVGFRGLMTPNVLIASANYAFLSLVDISIRAIQPLFFSTPIHLGGLSQDPAKIGTILAVYGVLNGLAQVFFFARVNDRFGSKWTFTVGVVAALPVFASFPIINALARSQGLSITTWVAVAFQVVISISLNFSYGGLTLVSDNKHLTFPPRSHFYLPSSGIAQPCIFRSDQWFCSVLGCCDTRYWTGCYEFSILALHRRALTGRMVCILCSHGPHLCRHLRCEPTSHPGVLR